MKPKVLLTHQLFPEAIELIKKEAEIEFCSSDHSPSKKEIIQKIKDKQGLLCLLVDTIDQEVIAAGQQLKVIANCAVGYNNIDVEYAHSRGIYVTNTPGVLTETTADLTWALLLAVARRVPEADRFTRAGRFTGWRLDLFLGQEVTGKQLGIIGLGRIGRAVAERAQGFKMKVVYTDPRPLPEEEERKLGVKRVSLDDLLKYSDFVTIHTALTPQTYHLISAREFALMKKEAILINVARGPVVDEKALVEALEKKQIWGAGLDVYEREPLIEEKLLRLDNVVLLPHIGSASRETRLKMALTAAKNLIQGIQGKKPDNLV
ncbi:MAG: D-glycerate dehydrogenase [Candidatus Aminicenantes bacterium]|nr:D-glycerate dehydrogenase [Candidatus Aminicenantes bacterium]